MDVLALGRRFSSVLFWRALVRLRTQCIDCQVTVTFNGRGVFPAVADTDGNWEVEFNRAGVGSGPGNVTVSGEDGPSITATNVMGGDVYFCR